MYVTLDLCVLFDTSVAVENNTKPSVVIPFWKTKKSGNSGFIKWYKKVAGVFTKRYCG